MTHKGSILSIYCSSRNPAWCVQYTAVELLDPEGQSCEDWMLEKKLATLHASYRIRVFSKDNISSNNHNMAKAIEMAISTEDQKRLTETLHMFSWRGFFV